MIAKIRSNVRLLLAALVLVSIGTGAFFSALTAVAPTRTIATACGVEIDPGFAEAARSLST